MAVNIIFHVFILVLTIHANDLKHFLYQLNLFLLQKKLLNFVLKNFQLEIHKKKLFCLCTIEG